MTSLTHFMFFGTGLCVSVDPNFQAWLAGVSESDGTGCTNIAIMPPTSVPETFALYQNYPNPFNPSTTIRFDVPRRADVCLTVYDILGRVIAVLADGTTNAGRHEVLFDASTLSSGIYFYYLKTPDHTHVKSMLLIR